MADLEEQAPLETVRGDEFEDFYSNSVQFEATLWDLRLIFGQTDLAAKKIQQHTAISLSWPQAKITAYFMAINIVAHQAANGNIYLPSVVIPPKPDINAPVWANMDKRTVEYFAWMHEQFFGNDPYVPPAVAALDESKG